MDIKRVLLIGIAALLVLLIGLLVAYQYVTSSLYANRVPIVEAKTESFETAIAIPEEVEEITEEEYHAALDQEAQEPEPTIEPEEEEAIYERVEITDRVYNVLLLGDDARINEPRARSDTMMLVSYNRDTRVINVVSFMRDMFVPTGQNGGSWNRINTAYASGGPGRAINTINNCFTLDVQRYVIVRFDTVFALVDQLDGLDIEMTAEEARVVNGIFPEYEPCVEGVNHLNGRQVLAYARMRHIGKDGDFGRTLRQRYVIRRVVDTVLDSGGAKELMALLQYMVENVETNVPMDEIITLGMEVIGGDKPVMEELRVPVDKGYNFGRYNGASVITVDFKKNVTALHEFLYGTAEGVKIPRFERPAMDTPEPFVTVGPDGFYPLDDGTSPNDGGGDGGSGSVEPTVPAPPEPTVQDGGTAE